MNTPTQGPSLVPTQAPATPPPATTGPTTATPLVATTAPPLVAAAAPAAAPLLERLDAVGLPRGTGALVLLGAGVCVVACLGKSLSGLPFVAQALQLAGLVYLVQLAARQGGRLLPW